MSLLNFSDGDHGPAAPRSKKPLKLILGIGALAGVVALGSTLAANINLNAGGAVEFGQGVAQTVACGGSDVSIVITPKSTFRNETGAGSYRFSSFLVSNIPSQCNGIDFTFKFYGATGGPLNPIQYDWTGYKGDFNYTDIKVHFAGVDTTGSGSNNLWEDRDFGFPINFYGDPVNGGSPADSRTSSSFEVTFWYDQTDAPGLLADDVKKITVESKQGAFYYPSGPQENVAMSTITGSGWSVCYSADYGTPFLTNTISQITTPCTGKYLLVLGRATGGSTALLLSAALRTDVIAQTTVNTPHLANGSWWYWTPDVDSGDGSFGFAPVEQINQDTCDYDDNDATSQLRLCWHITENSYGGYRIGTIGTDGSLEDFPTGYLKEVYQHN